MQRRTIHGAVLAVIAGAALTSAASAPPQGAANAQTAPALVDLRSPEELKKQFNDDRGHTRLVLLLSPT
ncbi:MAG TPA: hypothetical protein VKE51_18385 [Vicinamibacterales bacterium]|nr:hypothetical protein [Vicinamibacterales bacterium]